MKNKKSEPFGSTLFVLQGEYWYHNDASGKRIGGPYRWAAVLSEACIAEVTDKHDHRSWLIDVRGREIAEAVLAGNHRGHKDGPGPIVWIGSRSPEDDLVPRTAVMPDGTIIGTFDRISIEPYNDVRWVEKGGTWRLLGADGKLRGLRGITNAYDFSDSGLALVRIGSRFAFLNTSGQRAWRKSYDDACDFYKGCAWVREPDGWVLINAQGQKVGAFAYDEVHSADADEAFTIAQKEASWFLVRREDGLRVPDEAFDEVQRDPDGRGRVFILRRGDAKESFNAMTGERKPHDARMAHARTLYAAGFGGE
ncbi:MAG: hypothetical protein WC866_05380 [Patescibacteria group bacterium]|jgi:hypothetical protein